MNSSQLDELFQLFEKYELSISNLYETFGNVLPETKEAWIVFAKEERLHAEWINRLYAYAHFRISMHMRQIGGKQRRPLMIGVAGRSFLDNRCKDNHES